MVSTTVFLSRGHTDSVTTLALSDRLLASGGDDGNVYFWSPSQSNFPLQFTPRQAPCSTVKFNPDNPEILYSAHGRYINTWDLRCLRTPVTVWNVNEDEVNSIDVLQDEARLAAADDSGAVQVIDVSSGSVIRTLKKHDNICSVAKFRPKRTWQLVSGGLDCRVIVSDWKGTGRGVIIFELDEIVSSNLFGDSHSPINYQPHELSNLGSSDSHASSSEYAEVEYDEFDETDEDVEDDDDPDSHRLLGDIHSTEQDQDPSDLSSNPSAEPLESTSVQVTVMPAPDTWRSGIPVNPPMVHSIACSASGDFVAAGLEKSTIELFAGDGKRLAHLESLYGHRRAVSTLLFIGDDHLISGGNDYSLFLWTLGADTEGQRISHDAKVNAIEGKELQKIFIADYSPVIRLLDMSLC
ncbi:hypothetical protein P879_06677 [Paragonimus westermani]|uniref:WD repeat-containing protein 53 n=1 Tax=Paragonimus westermani TaxID=34504 RepID=A0A8T0D2P9_9TREM|nr:hypothetical protein P879_06677 [Paragonimus westermani]